MGRTDCFDKNGDEEGWQWSGDIICVRGYGCFLMQILTPGRKQDYEIWHFLAFFLE